jgi:hypothetical protein
VAGAGRGFDASFEALTARCDDVPIKEYAGASQRRRFGRLAKLKYVAASRALSDAGRCDPSKLAVVTGTALGEATVTLELLAQIHETRGGGISPSLVPNSVHNSPAGHLTIGLANHQPSVTVSQGWLSACAALVAAEDYLLGGLAEQALVIVGDEADPEWTNRLASLGARDLAQALSAESFQETAVALVVGTRPGVCDKGALSCAVDAAASISRRGLELVFSLDKEIKPGEPFYLGGESGAVSDLEAVAAQIGAVPERLAEGIGTSGGGVLALLTTELGERGFWYAAAERQELAVLRFSAPRLR